MRHSIYSIFFDQAAEHEAHERYDEALNLLYQVHRWAAEDPELWLRMGVLSFLMTDRAWLARVGKTDSHLADMGTVNARLYLAEARARGEGPRFAFWEGWVRHALYQDTAGAREALAAALAADPRHPYSHAGLARLELAEAQPGYERRAIAHLHEALARLPESARFHYDLGACHAGLGELAEAGEAFARARACSPLCAPDAMGRYLASTFHADGESVGALIDRLYPQVRTDSGARPG